MASATSDHSVTFPAQAFTHFAYPRRDGQRQAELTWVATYRDSLPARRRSPIQALTVQA